MTSYPFWHDCPIIVHSTSSLSSICSPILPQHSQRLAFNITRSVVLVCIGVGETIESLSTSRHAREVLFDLVTVVLAFQGRAIEFLEKVVRRVQRLFSDTIGPLPPLVEFEAAVPCLLRHCGSENEHEVVRLNRVIFRSKASSRIEVCFILCPESA